MLSLNCPSPRQDSTLSPAPDQKRGFAVVIALSLMAFIVLLLISMATLIQVETETANIQKETLRARQNALLGAYIAVGNLQKNAGQDQRVTATGEILNATDPSRAKVTGIWDSDPSSPTFEQPIDWLVSRSETAAFDPDTFNTNATDPNTDVELVSERRSGQIDQVDAVLATPIALSGRSGISGQFAWWVGDEGVKASLGVAQADFTGLSATEVDLAETDSASRLEPSVITGLGGVANPDDWSRVYERTLSRNLDSSTGFQDALDDNFHDITGRSYAVLSNVKDGGLKKDLTAGLVLGRSLMEDDLGYNGLFPDQWGGSTDNDPGGPLWEQMRDFYNTRVTGTGAGTLTVRTTRANDIVSISPVITRFQLYVHAVPRGGSGVRFYVIPAVTLWNPYQHNLSMPSINLAARLFNPRWQATGSNAGGGADPGTSLAVSSFPSDLVWSLPSRNFAPGEAVVFTMDQHEAYSAGNIPDLTAGWNAGFGLYTDNTLLDGSSAPVSLVGDLHVSHQQATGNAYIYLTDTTSGDFDSDSFVQMRRVVFWTPDNVWRRINASSGALAPVNSTPLSSGNHGSNVPVYGYLAVAKFHEASLGMTWIGAPEESTHLAQYNIRSSFSSRSPSELLSNGGTGSYNTNPLYTSGSQSSNALYSDAGSVGTGYAATLSSGLTEAGYFQFFRADLPVVSIGQFMHAELTYTNVHKSASTDAWLFSNYQPAFAIGNSLADPRIPNTETYRDWDDFFGYRNGTHYDQSYLQNEALWDRFFLSGLPRDGEPFRNGSDGDNILDQDDFNEGAGLRLPNPRLTVIGNPPIIEMAGDNNSSPDLDSYATAAKHLLNDGALNFNSISENAWKAMFASFLDDNVRTLGSNDTNNDLSPITRTTVPMERLYNSNSADSPRSQSGYRALNRAEVDALSTALATAIRGRINESGRPFMSFGEFVNRSITSSRLQDRLRGVMQEAIDASGINSTIGSGEELYSSTSDLSALETRGGDPTGMVTENIIQDKSFGISGNLMAADIFAKFGHMLSPRSDTFTVRSYGSASSQVTNATSEAYCEMIVQRIPETVDPTDNILDPTGSFGRQFKILSVRWIDKSSI